MKPTAALPCSNLELERQYLRACYSPNGSRRYTHLNDPDARLSPRDFAFDACGRIMTAFIALTEARTRIEPVVLRAELAKLSPRNVGPDMDVFELIMVPSATEDPQPKWMVAPLRELAVRRRKRESVQRALAALDNGDTDAADEHLLLASAEAGESREGEFLTAAASAEAAIAAGAETASQTDTRRTGHPRFDQAYGSLRPKSMLTIGGTTGSGKSSFALSIVMNMARRGHRVGIVSLEDDETVWGERALAHVSGVNPTALRGDTRHLIGRIGHGVDALSKLGVHFAYELNRPLADVRRAMRHMHRVHRIDTIVIDYVQAIRKVTDDDRREFIQTAAATLKSDAQELGLSLILLSQLRRASADHPYAEPHVSSLKESGDLENMSEGVVLLWKTGDKEDSPTMGKLSKIKWDQRRPRFTLQRDAAGSVVGLGEAIEQAAHNTAKGNRRYDG